MTTDKPVKSRTEQAAIRTALEDAELRAILIIRGTLAPLAPDAQQRVLEYIDARLEGKPGGAA